MKKNILFIANGPLEDALKGTPIRIQNFLKQITKKHNLFVCADNMDKINGVKFFSYPHLSKIKTLFYLTDLIKKEKIDVIFITSELLLLPVIILKILTGSKIAVDLHGLYFEEWYYYKRIGFIYKILKEIENRIYLLFFDLVFVVSEKLKEYYKSSNKNIKVIYGGADLEIFSDKVDNKDDNLIIGYMGNSRTYQGLEYLLAVASKFKKDKSVDFKLNLIISGNEDDFYKLLNTYDLRDVSLVNFNVKHSLVGKIISQSNILVIPRPSLKMTEYAFPSKLTEYLSTGIVTVVTNVGPVEELLRGRDCCFIIDHKDIRKELENIIIKLNSLGTEGRKRIGANGRYFVRNNLTWDVLGKKINESFFKL